MLAVLLLVCLSCSENNPIEPIPEDARPVLSSITPEVVAFRDTHVVVVFEGNRFFPETFALSGNIPLETSFLDSTRLEVLLRDEDLAIAEGTNPEPHLRNLALSVSNINVGGGQSNSIYFPIRQPNPVPEVHSITPSEFPAGTNNRSLEILGADFIYESTVEWDGQIFEPVSFYSPTELHLDLPDSALAHGGEIPVRVINPIPGGGASNTVTVLVSNSVPVYESHSPVNLAVGAGAQTLTISGNDFVPDTVVIWNGEERSTTFLDRRTVTIVLEESETASTGSAQFSLLTPNPSGGQTETVDIFFYLDIAHDVNFLLYDQERDLIYLAISSEGDELADKVLVANPATGTITATLATGNNPNTLALTDDGNYLYIGFRDDYTIRRIRLDGAEDDLVFSVEIPQYNLGYAYEIVPMTDAPGSITTLTVYLDYPIFLSYVMVYDEGIQRPNVGPAFEDGYYGWSSCLEPTSNAQILLSCAAGSPRSLKEITITSEGTTVENLSFDHPLAVDPVDIHTVDGLVYSDAGYIFDEQTLATVGQFDSWGPMTVDLAASQAYFLSGTSDNHYSKIQIFGLESRELEGEILLQMWTDYFRVNLSKVGTDGLAFISSEETARIFRDTILTGQ